MSATVKVADMSQRGRLEVRHLHVPDPEPGAVILEMSMSGICGTDKHNPDRLPLESFVPQRLPLEPAQGTVEVARRDEAMAIVLTAAAA